MMAEMKEQGKFTGKHMAIAMVAFFGVIVAVNLTMATLASRTWTGLVVKNSYVASQDFNAKQAAARKQAALGWHGRIARSEDGIGFDFSKRNGEAITSASVAVIFRRPATEQMDQTVTFTHRGKGHYSGDVLLGSGNWTAEVNATLPDSSRWKEIYNIYVAKDGSFPAISNQVE